MTVNKIDKLIYELKVNRSNQTRSSGTLGTMNNPDLIKEKNALIAELITLTGKSRKEIIRMSRLDVDKYGNTILLK